MRKTTVVKIGIAALFLIASIYLLEAQNSGTEQGNYLIKRALLSGSAKLVNGSVEVKFKEGFSTRIENIRVVASPVGSWSGIVIKDVNRNGFTAISETGDPNSEFNWIAVGEFKEPAPSIRRDAVPKTNE